MIGRLLPICRVAGVMATVLVASLVLAQVDNFLDEDGSAELDEEDVEATEDVDLEESNLDLSILFKKLSDLESENRFLVDRIEQLENEFAQFRRENRERYTDLDERIRGLSGQATSQSSGLDGLISDEGTEDGTYQRALLLIRDKQYEEAISALEEMILTYPNGKQVANGFYNLGELYKTIEPKNLEKARQNFVQLIRLYPKHTKVPEAKYKLGTIYHELDDTSKALEYLDEVLNEFPGTSVARLAKEYAETLREIETLQDSAE